MNDPDAVTQCLCVRENMCGEENCLAFGLQFFHHVAHFTATHRIEAGHRLVEKNYPRIMQNGLCNAHTLQHAF